MKKILIGCGVVIILIIGLFVIGSRWVFKNVVKMGEDIKTAETELRNLSEDIPFNPPPDGALRDDRLQAWFKVREAMMDAEQKLIGTIKEGGTGAVGGVLNLLPGSLNEAAEVLRREKMSPREYAWITDQVIGALKSRPAMRNPRLSAINMQIDRSLREMQDGKFRLDQEHQIQFAPLAPEEAQPILDRLQGYEDRLGKTARLFMADGMLLGWVQKQFKPGPTAIDDAATTR